MRILIFYVRIADRRFFSPPLLLYFALSKYKYTCGLTRVETSMLVPDWHWWTQIPPNHVTFIFHRRRKRCVLSHLCSHFPNQRRYKPFQYAAIFPVWWFLRLFSWSAAHRFSVLPSCTIWGPTNSTAAAIFSIVIAVFLTHECITVELLSSHFR